MTSCKPTTTPVDTKSKLSTSSGSPYKDPTHYRRLAGALQYLTFTRPNISYAVQQVCLHTHDPKDEHMNALKRIMRYLQGTLDHDLHLYKSSLSGLMMSKTASARFYRSSKNRVSFRQGVMNLIKF